MYATYYFSCQVKNPYIKRKLCDLRNKNVNVQMALATI